MDSRDKLLAVQVFGGLPWPQLRALLHEYEAAGRHWEYGRTALKTVACKGTALTAEERLDLVTRVRDEHLPHVRGAVGPAQLLLFELHPLQLKVSDA